MTMKLKNILCVVAIAACSLAAGCSTLTETGKKIWGSSMAQLEQQRSEGKSATFDLSLESCFDKTQKILEASGATVYLQEKHHAYMAAMNFQGYVDTTQVGIFFTRQLHGQTQVEVASMIPRLTVEVTDLIFKGLREEMK